MEEDQPIFQTSDLDDDIIYSSDSDDEPPQLQPEPLNHIIPDPYPSSSDPDDVLTSTTTTATTTTTSSAVTVAIPSSFTPQPPSAAVATTTAAAAAPRPIDDSRKLFQRLWTDEDEIELLQGFLDYTATRGPTASGHYHDTGPFYDQIKNKLQLDFNKNQLVEKLRRLKKKYRVNLSKINSGKDFVFKSPHDHATFEISKKIWCNVSENIHRGGISGVEFDFDDHNHNPNPNPSPNSIAIATGTPPRPLNSSYVISHINLNSASPGGGGGGSGGGGSGGFDMMLPNWSGNGISSAGGLPKLCTRKRSRVATNSGKAEEKFVKTEGGVSIGIGVSNTDNYSTNYDNNAVPNNVGVSPPLQGLVEETVRNCLSPVLKDLINNAVNGASSITSLSGSHGLNFNPVPMNVSGVNVEGGMDEKWRKQQMLELEVYSKRLELVQEQIKLSLEQLRSPES